MLLEERPRRRYPIRRYLLLTSAGVTITVGGGLALNFDVLVLGIGCVVVGVVGIVRRGVPVRERWDD